MDQERDAKEKAERKAYGEPEEEKAAAEAAAATETKTQPDDMTFGNFKVEVKRGPAPDSSKGLLGVAGAAAAARRLAQAKEEEKLQTSLRLAQEAAERAGKDTAAAKQALSVVAKLNAQLRAHKLVAQSQIQHEELTSKRSAIDATEFHAIIPINDYPQKARWRVTNKETMVQVSCRSGFVGRFARERMLTLRFQLIDMTGASVTNKGERRAVFIHLSWFLVSSRPKRRYLLRGWKGATARRAAEAASPHRIKRGVEGELFDTL